MNYELRIKTLCALCLMWLVLPSTAALMPIKWIADGSDNKPFNTTIAQGETRELQATLKNYGQPVTVPNTATAELYYQTSGMGNLYWPGGPATVTTNGIVTATWTPALDTGEPSYTFNIGVLYQGKRIYTAYGQIRMRPSPGWVVNEVPLPWRSLDFANIEIINPPWATPTIISNMIAGIEGGGGIDIEVDPKAYGPATNALKQVTNHIARVDNPHAVTAEQVGALPAAINEAGNYIIPRFIIRNSEVNYSSFQSGKMVIRDNSLLVFSPLLSTLETGWGYSKWLWPDTQSLSPLIKRDELEQALEGIVEEEQDPLAVLKTGSTSTGLQTLAPAGIAWQGVDVATNYIVKAEYDGTNINFIVYEVAR